MPNDHELFREWDLYDRIGQANYMRQREVAEAVRGSLSLRSAELRVLDLGCGDGRMSLELLAKARVAEFVGVDLSESALGRFESRNPPGSHPEQVRRSLRHGDIEEVLRGLPDESFDLVHAGYSLHHYRAEGKTRVLDQIARVLRNDGWLIWTDILRGEAESRDDYIGRLESEVETGWLALLPEQRRSVIEHVQGSDFPEPESWMIEQVENRGLQFRQRLYRDDFYTSLLFEKRDR
jgi:ubiquinone/menaquinone biosynthesis C-methylase UbiE